MRILSWLLGRWVGKRDHADSRKEDLCIDLCKHAVLDTLGNYICFMKEHELRRNSVTHGCNQYVAKGVVTGELLCPNCGSDLIDTTPDGRFKCATCGRRFS